MSFGLNNDGEVALLSEYFENQSVIMGTYRESDDQLTDNDSIEDVTTEPQGSLYSRQSVDSSEVSVSLDDSSGLIAVNPQTFNVSDSGEKVDATFLYNSTDGLFIRLAIDTSTYPNDYVDTAELDNLRLGGDALTLE